MLGGPPQGLQAVGQHRAIALSSEEEEEITQRAAQGNGASGSRQTVMGSMKKKGERKEVNSSPPSL